ncbi:MULTISPECIES: MFS transporter [unclassified Micromonospora]|uniref:MFS transporter n=1 Tax=unclassified Micromonospora TaxID=2617518 RepID=UPI003644D6B0
MKEQRTQERATAAPGGAKSTVTGGNGLLLFGLSLGYFLVMLDTTIVTVALPSIGDQLSGGLSALQWVSNAYTVTFAGLLLTAGALSDRFGGRRVFLIGLWAFAILSAACALASSMEALIVLRALLGIAGALLVPTSLALIATVFSDPGARAKALGVWAALSGSGLVAGPLLGGVLTAALGWRSIFIAAVPFALISIIAVSRLRAETTIKPGHRIDLVGQISAVTALASLTYGLIQGGATGWSAPEVLTALLVFLIAAAVFVAAERRPQTETHSPMLPARMFRNRTFSAGLFAGALVNFGLSGVLFVLSLFLQDGRGYTAAATGAAFLPLTVPTAFNPIFTGRLVARVGPRVPATVGFLMMAVGTLVQVPFSGSSARDVTISMIGLLVLGLGVSFAIPSLLTAVVSALPKDLTGIGSGALNSSRQTGAVLGVAVLGAILNTGSTTTSGARAALTVAGVALVVGAVVVAAFVGRRN